MVILAAIAYIIVPVSLPLILAFITALLLDPIVKFFSKNFKTKRQLAVLSVFILFILFIGMCGYFITTKVIAEVIRIIDNSPLYFNEISKIWFKIEIELVNVAKDLPTVVVNQFTSQTQEFLQNARESILSYVNINNLRAILTNIPNYLVSFIIYLVSLFLFMLDLPKISEKLYLYLTETTAKKVTHMTSRLSFVIFGFLKAQILISIMIFIISIVWLHFINQEIAFYMSILIWVADFIPIFGSLIVLGPWALFYLLTGKILLGLVLVILAVILLAVKRTVKPKLLGSQFGLSPLATLIGMYLGFKIIGLLGIIIGPLLLIIFYSAKDAGILKFKFKL